MLAVETDFPLTRSLLVVLSFCPRYAKLHYFEWVKRIIASGLSTISLHPVESMLDLGKKVETVIRSLILFVVASNICFWTFLEAELLYPSFYFNATLIAGLRSTPAPLRQYALVPKARMLGTRQLLR